MLANIENIIEKKTFKYDLMGSKKYSSITFSLEMK